MACLMRLGPVFLAGRAFRFVSRSARPRSACSCFHPGDGKISLLFAQILDDLAGITIEVFLGRGCFIELALEVGDFGFEICDDLRMVNRRLDFYRLFLRSRDATFGLGQRDRRPRLPPAAR
jgi:hypothetical protein